MRILLVWLLLALGTAAGCRSNANTGTAAPTECTWPASASPADAGPWGPIAARYLLRCKDGPDFEICLSDDPNTCPGPNAIQGGTISDCVDQCAETEYAINAGGPPEFLDGGAVFPPAYTPPANCRSLFGSPSGVASWCCPCE